MTSAFKTKAATAFYRRLLDIFIQMRKRCQASSRDEFAWQRLWFLRGRRATLKTNWDQLLNVRLDSLGDMQAAFGRAGEEAIPGILSGLPSGGTVLDIGAHIGGFSVIAARAVGPSGKVFAIEPIAENVALLEANVLINEINWIVPIQAAVGRRTGSVQLLVSDTDTMWATMRSTWSEQLHHGAKAVHTKAHEVPLITVDSFLADRGLDKISLIKIDVEAAEMDVLIGAAHSLASGCIEQLVVEVHTPTVKWNHIAGFLRQYGYSIADAGGGEMWARRVADTAHSITLKPEEKPVTIALLGCGAVSELQYTAALDAIADNGQAETIALIDPSSERREQLLRYFPTAQAYATVDAMLKEVTPELAIVAAPHRFHEELTVQCLDRGIHVLCEKPMAITTAECDRMIAAGQRAQRLIAVGHFRRFYPSCEMVKKILQSQILGRIKSFRFLEGYRYNWPLISPSVFDRAAAGGGVLIDTGAHALDLLLWWLGDIAHVDYQDDAMGGVEANCQLRMEMANGARGIVRLSRDWPLANSCYFEGEYGWLEYSCDVTNQLKWGLYGDAFGMKAELYERVNGFAPRIVPAQQGRASDQPMEYFIGQLRNVVDALRGRGTVRIAGTDARKVIALIEFCYQNRGLLDMGWLGDHEAQRARDLAHA